MTEDRSTVRGRRELLAGAGLLAVPAVALWAKPAEATGTAATQEELLAAVEQTRLGANAYGGGTIGVEDLTGGGVRVRWDGYFLVGPGGRGDQVSASQGAYAIGVPASGTNIPILGSTDTRTVVTVEGNAWVPLGIEALYYILPVPLESSTNRPSNYETVGTPSPGGGTLDANFRIIPFGDLGGPLEVPANWVPVAIFDPFSSMTRFINGVSLAAGERWSGDSGPAQQTKLAAAETRIDDVEDHLETVDDRLDGVEARTDPLRTGRFLVTDYGVKPGTTTTGSVSGSTLTADHASGDPEVFPEDASGALVVIRGVGDTYGGDTVPVDFWTTIASVTDPFTVTLASAPPNPGSGKTFSWSPAAQDGINDAIEAARAVGGGTIVLAPGTYCVSAPIIATHLRNSLITGPGATIRYGSSHPYLGGSAPAQDASQVRSGLVLVACRHVTVEDLAFEGDYAHQSNRENLGSAIYTTGDSSNEYSQEMTYSRIRSRWGNSLLVEDFENARWEADGMPRGNRMVGCTSYGARGAVCPSTHMVISACHFELPGDDETFNNYIYSTHAIYAFAGRHAIVVTGNTFKNIRRWCLKAAGSRQPIRSIQFSNNSAWDCGGGVVVAGRDDQENAGGVITGNNFINCATNISGWNESAVVEVGGVKNAIVSNNNFTWTKSLRASDGTDAVRFIGPFRGTPTESALIEGNLFQARLEDGVDPSAFMASAIAVSLVGYTVFNEEGEVQTADPGGATAGVRIANNQIKSCARVGISMSESSYVFVEHNTFTNVLPITATGCGFPVIRFNTLLPGPNETLYAQIRMGECTWPIIYDNHGGAPIKRPGSLGSITYGRGFATSDNAPLASSGKQNNPVDFPLLGKRGRAVPTDGHPEIVMAYGSDAKVNTAGDQYNGAWTPGDTVNLNGTTFTYTLSSSPTSTQFNSYDTLITRLSGVSGYEAADYGDPFGVHTHHIRIRRTSRDTGSFLLEIKTRNSHAGRSLPNGTTTAAADVTWCQGRHPGETVIWSPLCDYGSVPTIVAANTSGRALLRENGFYVVEDSDREGFGSSVVLDHGEPDEELNEEFRWSIS